MGKIKTAASLIFFVILVIVANFFYLQKREALVHQEKIIITPEMKVEEKKQGSAIVKNKNLTVVKDSFTGGIDDIIRLVNEARAEEGKESLSRNEKLNTSAMRKAVDMKEGNYFDHVSPDGLEPWFFIKETGYNYKTVGENLAEGFFSTEDVHNAWMESPGHRENILSENFEEMGVAILETTQNGNKSFLIVQHFGTVLKESDVKKVIVCDKKNKEWCDDLEDEKDEVKDVIEKQEDIIDDAKDAGASKEQLEPLYDNLEDLKDAKREIKNAIKKCKKYMEQCDRWE